MPYSTAMDELSAAEVMLYSITFSEFEGARFNWHAMQFEEKQSG
ncbi:hypothetical protein [Acetobacter sacchari]|nr:hypothetical protein [Acetobacter sacchari]